jgi:dihydrofolate synthase/folylpolyglutamate synthase
MLTGPLTVDLPLLGQHQAGNLAVALGLVELLREQGYLISDEQVQAGAREVQWPGRLQIVSTGPWIILDAAHNEPAAKALVATLPQMVEYDNLLAIIGLSAEKDAVGFCRELARLTGHVILTQARISRALPAEDLARLTADIWPDARTASDTAEALDLAQRLAGPRDCLLITGSFYVVGEAMSGLRLSVEGA